MTEKELYGNCTKENLFKMLARLQTMQRKLMRVPGVTMVINVTSTASSIDVMYLFENGMPTAFYAFSVFRSTKDNLRLLDECMSRGQEYWDTIPTRDFLF